MHRATPESPRMFDSGFIDYFSRTHPAAVPVLFVPTVCWMFYHSIAHRGVSVFLTAGLCALGFLLWTFSEYWLHRKFFHWHPGGKWGERMHFLVHGVHHQWPKDKYRLVMPPAVGISLYFIFLGLFYPFFGERFVWAFYSGYVIGYMTYDLTHYYIHHHNPRSRYGIKLKKHHMLHHFKDDGQRFGVSNMFWDRIFGTSGEPKSTS